MFWTIAAANLALGNYGIAIGMAVNALLFTRRSTYRKLGRAINNLDWLLDAMMTGLSIRVMRFAYRNNADALVAVERHARERVAELTARIAR
jgi:hypothetical protein